MPGRDGLVTTNRLPNQCILSHSPSCSWQTIDNEAALWRRLGLSPNKPARGLGSPEGSYFLRISFTGDPSYAAVPSCCYALLACSCCSRGPLASISFASLVTGHPFSLMTWSALHLSAPFPWLPHGCTCVAGPCSPHFLVCPASLLLGCLFVVLSLDDWSYPVDSAPCSLRCWLVSRSLPVGCPSLPSLPRLPAKSKPYSCPVLPSAALVVACSTMPVLRPCLGLVRVLDLSAAL